MIELQMERIKTIEEKGKRIKKYDWRKNINNYSLV